VNRQFNPNLDDIKTACAVVQQNIRSLSLEDKRLAMEALQVKVWIDGNNVAIEGVIPIPEPTIVSGPPGWS
jgi:hypothetical protein